MADITVTAASVVPFAGYTSKQYTAGATITQGQVCYLDSTDSNKAKLADADAATTDDVIGIALTSAASGQPIVIQTGGSINPGGTVTVGQVYVASTTAGGIAPYGDLLTGDFVTVLGVGLTSSKIGMSLYTSSVAKP